jgi:hypothetical protein
MKVQEGFEVVGNAFDIICTLNKWGLEIILEVTIASTMLK